MFDPENPSADAGRSALERMGFEVPPELAGESKPSKSEAQSEPAPTPAEEPKKWVHELTGKEFDSEIELLRYDSGFNNQRHGETIKALREELDGLKTKVEDRPAEPQHAPSDEEIMRSLWEGYDEEALDSASAKFVYQGIKKYDQNVGNVINSLREEIKAVRAEIENQRTLSSSGVDVSELEKTLNEHPYLKKLSFQEQVAVMKELRGGKRESAKPERAPRETPQPSAEDHVESSAVSSPPDDEETGFNRWLNNDFKQKDVNDQLGTLTQMIAKARKDGAFDDLI